MQRNHSKLFSGLRIFRELHRVRNPFAFLHEDYLIRLDVFQRVDLPAGPLYLQHVDLLGLAQAEVNPQITLRKIASTAANLVDLLMRLRLPGWMSHAHESSANPAAVRFRSDGANLDPVVIEFRIAA